MRSGGMVCLITTVIMCSCWWNVISSRPRYSYKSKENDLWTVINKQRTSQCSETGEVCFGSGYCCKNLVCVHQGNQKASTELSGQCVDVSELDDCDSDFDCRSDCRCAEVSGSGGRRRLCLPKTTVAASVPWYRRFPGSELTIESSAGMDDSRIMLRRPVEKTMMTTTMTTENQNRRWRPMIRTSGRFGSACESSADCSQSSEQRPSISAVGLCCQLVRRGRQMPKKMCDYINPISYCIQ